MSWSKWLRMWSEFLVAMVFLLLSLSRNAALIINYSAPLYVYGTLSNIQQRLTATYRFNDTNVCVGKEWYRFPSSFFLPHNRISFLESEFRGQLPQPFAAENGTSVELPNFNDLNKEERSRYVHPSTCHFIVDLDLNYQLEPHYADWLDFLPMYQKSFLDAPSSPSWSRAFYIPVFSDQYNKFRPYLLLRRHHKD
eukprot:TRINITY_DN3193_c0_g2_i5.p1 TRINITY_DN3193_c0_g2~~TRINITY_DN3193_c0_g2_i5.p1  ORF type:complete len:209 (+),score=64.21 TRINITY_DN3193_c0_g2_i5:45-629(+)